MIGIDYETVKDQFKLISADESDEVMDISMSSPMSEEPEDDASPKKSNPFDNIMEEIKELS